jgi:hypothetical protein
MEMNSRHARVPARPNLLLLDSTGFVSQLAERSKTCRSFSLGTLRADVPALRLVTLSRFHLVKDRRRADSPRLVVPDSSQHAHFYRCWSVGCSEAWVVTQDGIRPASCVFGSDSIGLRAGNLEVQQRYRATQCQACAHIEAQFRNPQTFRNFFGNIDPRNDPRVGHFRAEDPKSWASRVIVNDQGHFWLMFKCGENVECVYSQADLGEISLPGTFKAQSETGLPQEVLVSAWSGDRFALNFSPQGTYTFVRAPVSYNETVSAPGKVSFHGSFSQVRIDRDYIYLIQIWLWQSGERWVAYYVRRNAKCGSINDFVSASAYEGKPRGGQIYFTSATEKIEEFQISVPSPSSDQIDAHIFYNGRPLQEATLKRGSILYSPVYESAPNSDFDVTTDWLKTVSMGYFMSWKAQCPGKQQASSS